MKILVTGAAGFIGSHVCKCLLEDENNHVIGVDGFLGATPISFKIRHLKTLQNHPRFHLEPTDLLYADWNQLLDGVEAIFHLAGMPGVRSSWGSDFKQYVDHNILATQKLLEASRDRPLKAFVYASTSSVYGETSGKVNENMPPAPLSPYGISKLTGEYLCRVYHDTYNIPVTILRYFTVYGPGQRPDMAFHRFIRCLLLGESLPIYGDGKQTRDFTYVQDCVEGTVSVLQSDNVIGKTINIGGKERSSILNIIQMLEDITEKKAVLDFQGDPRGEPKHTWADITLANQLLGYEPKAQLYSGLEKEVNDLKPLYRGDKL